MNKKRKLLIVNQLVGHLFVDIANACVDHWDEVVLLTGKVSALSTPLNPTIKVAKLPAYKRSSTLSRFYSWMIGFIATWFLVLFRFRNHYLLISSNPPPVTLLPLFFRHRSSLMILDIYPEALVTSQFASERNWIVRIWKKFNRLAYPRSHVVFTLTEGMAEILKPYHPQPIQVISAWADSFDQQSDDSHVNQFLDQHGLRGKFIVLYSGNLGKEYEVEALLKVAELLRDEPRFAFVIAGKGWKKQLLEEIVEQKSLTNVTLLPFQEPVAYIASMNAMHVGVIAQAANATKICIPSKTFNLLAFHKPLLCIGDRDTELGNLISATGVGETFSSNAAQAMRDFLFQLSRSPEEYESRCVAAKTAAARFTNDNARQMVNILVEQMKH